MQNDQGQGISHASGDSKVPDKVQQQAPKGLEESLPDSVRYPSLPFSQAIFLPIANHCHSGPRHRQLADARQGRRRRLKSAPRHPEGRA
jgi:hypothetical protein